jgi:hypothetical protein
LIAEEADDVGDKGTGNNTSFDVQTPPTSTLEEYSSAAQVLGFLEDQHSD